MKTPQHINQVIQQPLKSEQQTQQGGQKESAKLSDPLIERLWEVMTDLFGHKWTSAHDYADNGTWASFLGDLEPLQIKAGIDRLKDWQEAWPPSATEFRNMCLGRGIGDAEQNMIANQQALQAKAPPLMIRKKPTEAEIESGNDALADLKNLF